MRKQKLYYIDIADHVKVYFFMDIAALHNVFYYGLRVLCLYALCRYNMACQSPHNNKINVINISVTGDNFNWKFRYPGPDGVLGNDDDLYSQQDLFLPSNAEINLDIISEDYLYSFALPDYGLKQIAVPGLIYKLHFKTDAPMITPLLGDQFCGFSHDSLKGKVHIINQNNEFYSWAKKNNHLHSNQI